MHRLKKEDYRCQVCGQQLPCTADREKMQRIRRALGLSDQGNIGQVIERIEYLVNREKCGD